MKRTLLKNTGIFLITVVSVLCFSEMVLRSFYNEPLDAFVRHSTKDWGTWFTEENVRISKTLGYEIVPNTRHYNSLGLPDRERSLQKEAGVTRIICVGDSVTARSQFPQFLETDLNQRKSGNVHYEVWNAGIVGYSLKQECTYIQEKIIAANPDLIIIGFCWNDFDTTPLVTRVDNTLLGLFPNEENLLLNPFLLQHSALYRLSVKALFAFKKQQIGDRSSIVLDTHKKLAQTRALLEKNNIPLFLVLLPMPESFEENNQWYAFSEVIKSAESLGVPYCDVRRLAKGRSPLSMRIDANDRSHLNPEIGRLIAREIGVYVSDNDYI